MFKNDKIRWNFFLLISPTLVYAVFYILSAVFSISFEFINTQQSFKCPILIVVVNLLVDRRSCQFSTLVLTFCVVYGVL